MLVPGYVPRRLAHPFGKVGCHRLQVLQGHGLGVDAGLVLKAVRPVVHPPQETEPRPDGQQGAGRSQEGGIGPAPPAPLGPGNGGHTPGHIPQSQEHRQRLHHLHDGEGHQVAGPAQPPPEGPRQVVRNGVHQGLLPPQGKERQQQNAVRQQPDMQFSKALKKSPQSHTHLRRRRSPPVHHPALRAR